MVGHPLPFGNGPQTHTHFAAVPTVALDALDALWPEPVTVPCHSRGNERGRDRFPLYRATRPLAPAGIPDSAGWVVSEPSELIE